MRWFFYNRLFKSVVTITGCSQYLLNEFQEIFPQKDSEKCLTVHNGVGELFLTQNLTSQKKGHIFTAARFVPKKGLELLFEAFKQHTDIALLIAGGDEKELEKLKIRIIKGTSLLGKLSPADLASHLSNSRITVIPSKNEPYGIIAAEAICCGSPVVATKIGGIPEVIALAKKDLSEEEKKVLNIWVKLVKPEAGSIRVGMNEILKNKDSIDEYIEIIPKVRKQFSWHQRLKEFNNTKVLLV